MPDADFLAQYAPEARRRREELMGEVARLDAFLALAEPQTQARQPRRTNGTTKNSTSPTSTGSATAPAQRPSDETVGKVLKFIERHPGTTIADMAAKLKVHPNTIRRSVKVLQVEQSAVRSLGRQFEDRREHFATADWQETPEAVPAAA